MHGIPLKIIIKGVLFSHYMVMFQEWYGDDNEADYLAIENSLRIADKNELSGMQIISNKGYSFAYDADKLMASTTRLVLHMRHRHEGGHMVPKAWNYMAIRHISCTNSPKRQLVALQRAL